MWEVSAASPHIVIQFNQQKWWFNGDWTNKYDLMGYVFAPNSTQQKKHQKAGKSGATSKFHRRWLVIMGPIVTEYSWDNGIIGKKKPPAPHLRAKTHGTWEDSPSDVWRYEYEMDDVFWKKSSIILYVFGYLAIIFGYLEEITYYMLNNDLLLLNTLFTFYYGRNNTLFTII